MTVLQQSDLQIHLTRALQLAQQLAPLHAAQRVHGGLHPQGLEWLADGALQLGRPANTDDKPTPARLRYASPEQAGHLPLLDARSDLYSLGLILYEWLAGQPAFDGNDPLDLCYRQLAQLPVAPEVLQPGLAKPVSALVMRLLAKAPDARYASARGLAHDLQHCLQQLQECGDIAPFTLCSADPGAQFRMPDDLQGRSAERTALEELFARAAAGPSLLCLVSGSPGSGKTALVRALRDRVAASGGHLVELACQRTPQQTPAAALFQALREQLPGLERLSEPGAAQSLHDVLPELLARCASRAHPLLLLLDDLQWADAPTLALFHSLLRCAGGAHLLLVGACSDEALDSTHPLAQWLADLRQQQALAAEFRLAPLALEDVSALIEGSCWQIQAPLELAALVLQKTHGNPFYTRQLLKTLVAEGRLYYNRQADGWRWSLDLDQLRQLADNVVDLVTRRLKGFAPRGQQALRVAACMGQRFELHLLAQVCGVSDAMALEWLAGAVQDEVLLPLAHRPGTSGTRAFQFAHDRLQQAARALAGAASLPALQLRIGRTLWQQTADAALEQQLFAIVEPLNQAHALLADAGERLAIARLNLRAARSARAGADWPAAARYLEAGIALLPARAWQVHPALCWELHLQHADCESVLRLDEAFAHSAALLLAQAQPAQRVLVQERLIRHAGRTVALHEALALGHQALAEAGLVLPAPDDPATLDTALQEALAQLRCQAGGRPLDGLLCALPASSDTTLDGQLRMLAAMAEAAGATSAPLQALLGLLGTHRALAQGHSACAPLVYALLARALCALGDYALARQLAQAAQRLADDGRADPDLAARLRLHRLSSGPHGAGLQESDLPALEQLFDAQRLADPDVAAAALASLAYLHYSLGRDLSEVTRAQQRVQAYCSAYRMDGVAALAWPCAAAAAALRGETPSPTVLGSAGLDEAAFVQAHGTEAQTMALLCAARITLHGLAGDNARTLELAEEACLQLAPPVCVLPAVWLWRGLAALDQAVDSTGARRSALLALGRDCSDRLAAVAVAVPKGTPDPVAHRRLLLRAARERALGHDASTGATLQQAAEAAALHGFLLEQGFCLERLGLWQAQDGAAVEVVQGTLQQAAACYRQAQALVLQRRAEERLQATPGAPATRAGPVAQSAQATTRLRQLEQQLADSQQHLAQQHQALQQAQAQAQEAAAQAHEARQAKADFLAGMGHAIRTPMNAIIGLSHLALRQAGDARLRDYLNKIRQSGQHLLGILSDMQDFSRVEAGALDMEIIPFALDTVFETLASICAERASASGLELYWHVAPDVPPNLIGDPLRLGQILLNYTSNAFHFTTSGEVGVSVSVVERDRDTVTLRFEVRDTGIGLTAQQIEGLFQRPAPDGVPRSGSGLGLVISKRLAGLMGGEVGVRSTPGAGSTFWFTATLGLGTQSPRRLLAADLRHKRVLVVDDNANAAAVLCEQLLVLGCSAHGLVSGQGALRELRRAALAGEAYDVLMTDWQMPEMDGMELVERLNASGIAPMPLKVLVTGFGRETAAERAANTGIAQILQKPVSNSMLLDGLMTLFGRIAQPPAFHPGAADNSTTALLDPVRGARILLVEDNEINRQVALEMLLAERFQIELAVDGKQAVDRVAAARREQLPFDLVLMDMQMPVMDGVAAARLMRSQPEQATLPIVAMTANAQETDRQLCLRAGMNDFVTKPIEPRQLWAAMLKWIAPRPGLGAPALPGLASVPGMSGARGVPANDTLAPTGAPAAPVDESALALRALRTYLERGDARALETFADLEDRLRSRVGEAHFRLVEAAMEAFELDQALELLHSGGAFMPGADRS